MTERPCADEMFTTVNERLTDTEWIHAWLTRYKPPGINETFTVAYINYMWQYK